MGRLGQDNQQEGWLVVAWHYYRGTLNIHAKRFVSGKYEYKWFEINKYLAGGRPDKQGAQRILNEIQ